MMVFDDGMRIEREHEQKLEEMADATTSELFERIVQLEADNAALKEKVKSREVDNAALQKQVEGLREALGWVKSPCRVNENTTATHCNGCEKLHSLEKSCKKAAKALEGGE